MQRKIIKRISAKNNGQVFFTTHSIEVAKVYDFSKIFLMKKGKINNLPDLLNIDKKFKIHVERYAKGEILSGLFSKGVLMVEGDSELSGLPMFSQLYSNGFEDSGVEISRGSGKDNVYKYASYYHKCGVPIVSLIDNDSDISSLLTKYKDNNIDSMILCQPKDYETSIISIPVFQKYWIELFEEKYPFNQYKDNYIKPFISKDSKSELLKRKYNEIQTSIKEIKTFSELICLLNEAEKTDFQREFLHINLAGIVDAKEVAIYLIEKSEEDELDENIPIAFKNIFNLFLLYMKNNSACENVENCIVNKVLNESYEFKNLCTKCGDIKQDYNNVIQIKGV
jgi:predicted ATP-dependent endonuclease of OLD family